MFKKNIKFAAYLLITVFLTLGFSLSLQSLLAAWQPPSAVAPSNNVPSPVYSTSSVSQIISGGYGLGVVGPFSAIDGTFSGNVGIGTMSPLGSLHVLSQNGRTLDSSAQPVMTSSNTPTPYVLSASSLARVQYAFDHDIDGASYWEQNNFPTVSAWLQIDFGDSNDVIISKYALNIYLSNRAPSAWTFRGSTDGTTWVDLDSQSGQVFSPGITRDFPISNTTAYRYYRLDVLAVPSGTTVRVNELFLYPLSKEALFVDSNTGKVGIGTTNPNTDLAVDGKIGARELCDENGSNCKDLSSSGTGRLNYTNCSWVDGGQRTSPTWSTATCLGTTQVAGFHFLKSNNSEEDTEYQATNTYVRARRPSSGSWIRAWAYCCDITVEF